jgi:hypothetical protein
MRASSSVRVYQGYHKPAARWFSRAPAAGPLFRPGRARFAVATVGPARERAASAGVMRTTFHVRGEHVPIRLTCIVSCLLAWPLFDPHLIM